MKYNTKGIMTRAWEIKRQDKRNDFGLCLRMSWQEAKEGKKMKGTEKQIAWAQDIIKTALDHAENNNKLNMGRYEAYDHHPMYLANAEAYKLMTAVLKAIFAAHDDAAWIIEHRTRIGSQAISQQADRWSHMIRSGRKTIAQIAAENGLKNYQA